MLLVGSVGKPRTPVTPATAVTGVVVFGLVIAVVVWAAVEALP